MIASRFARESPFASSGRIGGSGCGKARSSQFSHRRILSPSRSIAQGVPRPNGPGPRDNNRICTALSYSVLDDLTQFHKSLEANRRTRLRGHFRDAGLEVPAVRRGIRRVIFDCCYLRLARSRFAVREGNLSNGIGRLQSTPQHLKLQRTLAANRRRRGLSPSMMQHTLRRRRPANEGRRKFSVSES